MLFRNSSIAGSNKLKDNKTNNLNSVLKRHCKEIEVQDRLLIELWEVNCPKSKRYSISAMIFGTMK